MREREKREVLNLGEKRLIDINDLCAYCSLGRNNAAALGKNAGAVVRVGRRVLYDRKKIDSHIELMSE